MNSTKLQDYDKGEFSIYNSYRGSVKALNTLDGILKGIDIDHKINSAELDELRFWCECHRDLSPHYPFKELFPMIQQYTADGVLSREEYDDILWLCEKLQDRKYDGLIKMASQELHGVLHGVLADNVVSEEEAIGLSGWLVSNDFLQGVYPYDELFSLISVVLADRRLDEFEADMLKAYFADFIDARESWNLNRDDLDALKKEICIPGICHMCPEITFAEKTFCFTGESPKATRMEIAIKIQNAGGIYHDTVTKKTDYLLIGSNGSQCWAYSCYGRKVEKAVGLRRAGLPIKIVHENDFWDALMDLI